MSKYLKLQNVLSKTNFKENKYSELEKALKPLEPTFYVGLVVMDIDRKKILIGKRKEDGIWTGPGGGAGLDESPKQAAIREAFEEANLKIKPYQLKELPTLTMDNGKMCHCFLVFVDKKQQKIHIGNDPDKEVKEWIWHKIDEPLPGKTDENRLLALNSAKMKVMKLRKSEYADLEKALRGGLADKKKPSDFNPKALKEGIKVEMEHTEDPKIAEEIAMDHLTEDPEYYKKLKTIEKAIIENPVAGIDLNTAEQSQDELAAKDNDWVEIITLGVKDHDFGMPPTEVAMPENRTLIISKVDEGLYSAFIKNDDPNSGNYGEILTKFTKMTPQAMVQGLKAKGFLPMGEPKKELQTLENMEESSKKEDKRSSYSELAEALKEYSGKELHVHLHKD